MIGDFSIQLIEGALLGLESDGLGPHFATRGSFSPYLEQHLPSYHGTGTNNHELLRKSSSPQLFEMEL
jgi:hypothetical protein